MSKLNKVFGLFFIIFLCVWLTSCWSSEDAKSAPIKLPTLSVDKTTITVWEKINLSWSSNWWKDCTWLNNWNIWGGLTGSKWKTPVVNQPAWNYNFTIKCSNWISNVVSVNIKDKFISLSFKSVNDNIINIMTYDTERLLKNDWWNLWKEDPKKIFTYNTWSIIEGYSAIDWQANTMEIIRKIWDKEDNAANFCDKLILWWYNDWYLPAPKELIAVINYFQIKENIYWSSGDIWKDDNRAAYVISADYVIDADWHQDSKKYKNFVRCVRKI